MTHTHKRPRKILTLKHDIISSAMFGENTFSELIEACQLAILEYWRAIEEEYKIPPDTMVSKPSTKAAASAWSPIQWAAPTCPKIKKQKHDAGR